MYREAEWTVFAWILWGSHTHTKFAFIKQEGSILFITDLLKINVTDLLKNKVLFYFYFLSNSSISKLKLKPFFFVLFFYATIVLFCILLLTVTHKVAVWVDTSMAKPPPTPPPPPQHANHQAESAKKHSSNKGTHLKFCQTYINIPSISSGVWSDNIWLLCNGHTYLDALHYCIFSPVPCTNIMYNARSEYRYVISVFKKKLNWHPKTHLNHMLLKWLWKVNCYFCV